MTLLRTPDAAKKLGVSQSYLEKQRLAGTGPAFAKIGRIVAYRETDIDAWVATQLRHSTSQNPRAAA